MNQNITGLGREFNLWARIAESKKQIHYVPFNFLCVFPMTSISKNINSSKKYSSSVPEVIFESRMLYWYLLSIHRKRWIRDRKECFESISQHGLEYIIPWRTTPSWFLLRVSSIKETMSPFPRVKRMSESFCGTLRLSWLATRQCKTWVL